MYKPPKVCPPTPNKFNPVIQAKMSHADMSHTISTLRSICNTAQKIRKLTEAQAAEAPSYKSPRTFPELQLSFPDEVLSTLKSMDLPTNIYGNLRNKLFSWYQQMQAVHQRHYIQTCQRLCSDHVKSNSTFESIRLAFEASFSKRYVPVIVSHVRKLKERYNCDRPKPQSYRQPFQQAFAPLLEQYFYKNAYPSASDRATLANRTMNTPRQIEVWFQNHRNRAKKDGKTLKRSNSSSIIHDLFSSFASSVDEDSTPSDDEEKDTDDEHLSPPNAMPDLLNPPRPAHAFPTTFSERSNFDPFQKKAGVFKISPLLWPRQPVPPRSCSGLEVDFDAFIADFAEKLHLRDKSPKKQIRCSRKTRLAVQPWFSSTVVVPQKAPLSSLVRTLSCCPSPSSSLSSPSVASQMPSFEAIDSPFRHHRTPQSRTERRPRRPRFPSDFLQRTYPSWGSRSSSMSSISSTEPVTPPTSPSTDNLDLKIAGADYDTLQEILGPTSNSDSISDKFKFPNNLYNRESAFLFLSSPEDDIFSQTFLL